MNNLTLVIPAKYESESLPVVLEEIKKLKLDCKILISLSSDDIETINAIKKFNVEIYYQKKLGYGSALIEAINNTNTDYFCIFNADGSFNPRELSPMYEKLQTENDLSFIFASRYLKGSSTDDDTIVTAFGNFIFSMIGKVFFRLPISDILYTFVMGQTKAFKNLSFKSQDFSFCVEMPILLHKYGYKITDIISNERVRIAGKKKPNALKDGFLILVKLIELFFISKFRFKK